METAKQKRRVDTHKAKKKKVGQNAEVMPRPLNSSIVIHSLEVRTIFSLFVLKKHMLGFAQIISVFRTGWRFARVGVGYPDPEYVAVRRSVNGGLVHVCFSVTPGMVVSMREN